MGLFNHHTDAPKEASMKAEAHTPDSTAKDSDASTLTPSVDDHANKGETGQMPKKPSEKKHFWNSLHGKSDVSPVEYADFRKSKDLPPVGKPLNDGKLPKTAAKHHADQLDDGNLGQGLTWR